MSRLYRYIKPLDSQRLYFRIRKEVTDPSNPAQILVVVYDWRNENLTFLTKKEAMESADSKIQELMQGQEANG